MRRFNEKITEFELHENEELQMKLLLHGVTIKKIREIVLQSKDYSDFTSRLKLNLKKIENSNE